MEESKILLLEQEFKTFKGITDSDIIEIKKELNEQDLRIKEMELSKQKTEYQYEQIMETLKTLNEKTIPNLTAQIEELKNKPAKRYDQAVSGIIGAIFGAVGANIVSIFFK